MNKSWNRPGGRLESSTDFGTDMRSFLLDPQNAALLRDTICAPLIQAIESLRADLNKRDAIISQLQGKIAHLELQNDDLEQYTRRNSIRINGLPESENEDCEDLVLSMLNSRMSLTPPLTMNHIDRVHRLGKRGEKPRQIIVKFAMYHQRRRVMAKRASMKGSNIFINEDLTKKRNQLLYVARQEKKQGSIKDCWSYDGRILVRDRAGTIHQITNRDELSAAMQTR